MQFKILHCLYCVNEILSGTFTTLQQDIQVHLLSWVTIYQEAKSSQKFMVQQKNLSNIDALMKIGRGGETCYRQHF